MPTTATASTTENDTGEKDEDEMTMGTPPDEDGDAVAVDPSKQEEEEKPNDSSGLSAYETAADTSKDTSPDVAPKDDKQVDAKVGGFANETAAGDGGSSSMPKLSLPEMKEDVVATTAANIMPPAAGSNVGDGCVAANDVLEPESKRPRVE